MSQPVAPTCEIAVKALLSASNYKEQQKALGELAVLCEQEVHRAWVSQHLVHLLHDAESGTARTILISALGRIKASDVVQVLGQHLDPNLEKSERVRYRALLVLSELLTDENSTELKTHLEQAFQQDDSLRLKATALRLLIENECGAQYVSQFMELVNSRRVEQRLAALKALRSESGHKPLPELVEKKLIRLIGQRLNDESEWRDIRYQAALALGDVVHYKLEAVRVLGEALKRNPPRSTQRNCLESLARLHTPRTEHEIKEALLHALQDDDLEIRLRATEALKNILHKKAIPLIVEDMLRQHTLPAGYLDALRQIDSKTAAKTLSDNLLHPDPEVVKRAGDALAKLGGEEALRTLQAQRTQALNKYTELLNNADQQIMKQFDILMNQARVAFRMSMIMHGTTFILGIALIFISLYLATLTQFQEKIWSILGLGAGGGLVTLLTLFYRDPLRNISQSVNSLVKVNVVFLGYIRQINQIDATFKQMYLSTTHFSSHQMKETVTQIQDTVDETLRKVKMYLLDIEPDQHKHKNLKP